MKGELTPMRKLAFFLCAFALALAPPAFSQSSGTITTSSASNACPSLDASRMATVSIQITGTWTGTLNPQIAVSGSNSPQATQVTPSNSSTPQTTITANGVYYTSGGGVIYVCGPTSTGTANVYLQPVPGSARNNGGGSSGSSFPVASAQKVNPGGSIAPSGVGQNVSNQVLSTDFNMVSLGLTANASGGGLLPNHTIEVQYTLVNGTGESLPSTLTTIGTSASCPGNVCSVVVTAPTIPAGFNYNVYVCDNSSGGQACTAGPQKDTWDSPTGVNVPSGTNFTIQTWPNSATSSVPTVATAFYQPSPTENNVCAQQVNPITDWMQDASGNWWTYGGTNPSTGNSRTVPTKQYCLPVVWDDLQENNPSFNNSLVTIVHQAGNNTSTVNQDHALGVVMANATGDSTNHYAMEGIQVQLNFNGTGGISGSPDGEAADISAQLAYNNTTAGVNCGSYGCNVIRSVFFREPSSAYPASAGWGAGFFEFQNNSAVAAASTMAPVVRAKCLDATANASGLLCADFYADGPSSTFSQGYDAFLNDAGSGSLFFNIRSTAANENQGKNFFSGTTFVEHISPANLVAALAFTPPTCTFATGGGTTPGCAVRAGSADSLGRIVLTTGTGSPAGTGTATLTFHTSWGSPNTDSDCSFQARNDGGTWQSIVGFVITASSTSALTVQWTNGTTPTALTASTTYDLIYTCKGA